MVRSLVIVILLAVCSIVAVAQSADAPNPSTQPVIVPRESSEIPSLARSNVSIPWKDLHSLLTEHKLDSDRPPVDFAYAPANYEATATEKSVFVKATVDITLLVDGWTLAPIGPLTSGVNGVTVDGQPAALVVRADVLYVLLKGKGTKKLSLAISRDVVIDGEVRRFDLPLLPSAWATLSTDIPQKGLRVQATGASGFSVTENPRGTVAKGTFHANTLATISWQPAPAVQAAQVLATTLTRVDVERGSLRCHAEINYEIIHGGIDSLRVALSDGIDLTSVTGPGVRDNQTVVDGKQRTLVINLKEPARGSYRLLVDYVYLFDTAKELSPSVPLLTIPSAVRDRGFVGVEIRDNVEVIPTATDAQRIDVKELPEGLWDTARSPLLFGYRYDAPGVKLSLAIARHADLDVLVAMSDICEVSTTYTPDGKSITKMMYVTRNNLKQYMTLKLPEGAQLWSAFVDDHPVTPSKNAKGDVLIPLKKSDPEDADDDGQSEGKSYRARRDRRREEGPEGLRIEQMKQVREKRIELESGPPDLKPYDVEIVFVTPPVKLADRGQIKPALPQSDIPIGHLSWAIFLPGNLRILDTEGNVAEVSKFTLPFRHFGDIAYAHAHELEAAHAQQDLQQAAQADASKMAEHAKAQGVLPVRIEIPMVGDIHRFEKFLVVDEPPTITLTYSRRLN